MTYQFRLNTVTDNSVCINNASIRQEVLNVYIEIGVLIRYELAELYVAARVSTDVY